MNKLLWVGDAACQSGFAKSTHYILDILRHHWDVTVVGLNYFGSPHQYPYEIWAAQGPSLGSPGGDTFGINQTRTQLQRVRPDLVVIQNDPWNFPRYMTRLENVPVVGIVAVDGLNCRGRLLNGLRNAIFWTDFGLREARLGGYSGPGAVVPLGVDLGVFYPTSKREAREKLGLPSRTYDAFIVGNVNRNQPRKRLDLSIRYFAQWIKTFNVTDAYLFLHVAPTGERGFDCNQLAAYYGIQSRLILSEPPVYTGMDEKLLAATYNAFDIQLTTTQGEGMGLTTLEALACGVPAIVPDWSALGDWCDVAIKVPCTSTAATFNNINVIGGVADEASMVEALDLLYRNHKEREDRALAGLKFARSPRFDWQQIGEAVQAELLKALDIEPGFQTGVFGAEVGASS